MDWKRLIMYTYTVYLWFLQITLYLPRTATPSFKEWNMDRTLESSASVITPSKTIYARFHTLSVWLSSCMNQLFHCSLTMQWTPMSSTAESTSVSLNTLHCARCCTGIKLQPCATVVKLCILFCTPANSNSDITRCMFPIHT